MKKILLLLTLLLTLVSCGEKTPQDLFDSSKSGVVLIMNKFYYRMKLPNGNFVYFTGLDEDGSLQNLCTEYKDIKDKRQLLSGTGFFIDKQGTVMTNRHVAQPEIDKTAVKNGFNQMIQSLRAYYEEHLAELSQAYQALESQKADYFFYDDEGDLCTDNSDEVEDLARQQADLEEQFNKVKGMRDALMDDVSLDELQISVVCEVGIAYNGTYVNSESDVLDKNPCSVVKVSTKENVDLALLQLKDRKTPDDCYVFNTDGTVDESLIDRLKDKFKSHDDKLLQIDQQLYMIGYNAGPILANTQKGIQVQMTSGKVTQLPDGERVLYSIPTVQGSSGSPVIDSKGRLVAVNFAKLKGSDNFNFGIPLARVKEFME